MHICCAAGCVSRTSGTGTQLECAWCSQVCKPKDFAAQINLTMDHCWGIFRALVDMLLKLDDGKYLLVKDPNKELLRLYAVPDDAFETNYVEEPLAENDEVPAAPAAVRPAADEAADE